MVRTGTLVIVRRYLGDVSDNSRWEGLVLRDDDIVITTPGKCGTTWMQTMVGMLVFDRVDLPEPIGVLSPWVDMVTRPIENVADVIGAQRHRRFLKSHTPLDGIPWRDTITYLAVVRHPLDVAMSVRDHVRNLSVDRVRTLIEEVAPDVAAGWTASGEPEGDSDYLRWWIDRESDRWEDSTGSLAELVRQAQTYWEARDRPNVALFHYEDLWNDLAGQMRRLASMLDVQVDDARLSTFVEAARLDSMRSRAAVIVPESDLDIWPDPARFFKSGGRRNWADLLTVYDIQHYRERLVGLAGPELAGWLSPDG